MMTKIRHFVVLVLTTILLSAFGYAQSAPDAAELARLLNEFLEGAGRNDAGIHDRFWADDLIYTRGVGQRIDKAELMKGVRSAPARKADDPVTTYSAEDVMIRQYGNAAVVAFRLVGITTRPNGERTVSNHLNTGTFIKRDGRWQAVAWQATPVPDPAPKPTATSNRPVNSAADGSRSSDGRTYQKGPRGGCFYTSTSGKKVYVNKELCN